jgi:hypothetical protein
MKLDALIPLCAAVVGCYLILRSGYLRAVVLAPFRRHSGRVTVVVDALEFDFEPHAAATPEYHRHRAHLNS